MIGSGSIIILSVCIILMFIWNVIISVALHRQKRDFTERKDISIHNDNVFLTALKSHDTSINSHKDKIDNIIKHMNATEENRKKEMSVIKKDISLLLSKQ